MGVSADGVREGRGGEVQTVNEVRVVVESVICIYKRRIA